LQTCKYIRKAPDKTYKGSFNVRILSARHRQAAIFDAVKKVTLNEFVRYALDSNISKEKNGHKAAVAKSKPLAHH